jgi:SAM-dependent methyltransferase
MKRTEFYETAVKAGFYGLESSGLSGKKDNVRKYWEDMFIKSAIRSAFQELLPERQKLRIVDLGAGSGEGYELLTHIHPDHPVQSSDPFVLTDDQIQVYDGADLSPAMVAQGCKNYQRKPNVRFTQADLSQGFPFMKEPSYDIYFSSYGSLSHLTVCDLVNLSSQLFLHARKGSILVYDVYGRRSPEWPDYWGKSARDPLSYNMGYLLPLEQQDPKRIDWFPVAFWTPEEMICAISEASARSGRKVTPLMVKDRSILVGRHMDTSLFKPQRFQIRAQVNRLFDMGFRGEIVGLKPDMAYLEKNHPDHPEAFDRIFNYYHQWSSVIDILDALMQNDNGHVKQIIESTDESLSEELRMLTWLYRNADRFPVVDFWASIMGPQVACVLRNLEYNLPQGLGCGHSLLYIARVEG